MMRVPPCTRDRPAHAEERSHATIGKADHQQRSATMTQPLLFYAGHPAHPLSNRHPRWH